MRAALLAAALALSATVQGGEPPLKPMRAPAPPLALRDLDGQARGLADLRGKVVVVNFWATWCEPCRNELPSLERLREKLRGRPAEVIAVNIGEGEARIRSFLELAFVDLPVWLDRDSITLKTWNVRGLPSTAIVDRRGTVRYHYVGERRWDDPDTLAVIENLIRDR